ncbi:MAG: hypothetical protein GY816_02775 [Cytophagales bacterium]|nr:hypothetical protein [Cytophagales bacterium]
MVLNKFILASISLLLFVAMTLADTSFIYLEQELVESAEVERKEITEGKEGRNWIRVLLSGGTDYLAAQNTSLDQIVSLTCTREMAQSAIQILGTEIPLFIKYCCFKIHLA